MDDSTQFGTTDALAPGSPLFAGEQSRVQRVLRRLGGSNERNSASIVGPRRSGRSSALNQLLHRKHRAAVASLVGSMVVHGDLGGYRGRPEEAIQYVIDRCSEAFERRALDPAPLSRCDRMTDLVDEATRQLGGTLIFTLDNFDVVAADLRKDHQRDLRQAVEGRDAAYVVSAREVLSNTLEEIPEDESSELHPLVEPVESVLRPLRRREVAAIIGRRFGVTGAGEACARELLEIIGGQASWIQQALGVLERHGPDALADFGSLDHAALGEFEEEVMQELDDEWRESYRWLPLDDRWFIEKGISFQSDDWAIRDRLMLSGWHAPSEKDCFRPAGRLLERWLEERTGRIELKAHGPSEEPYEQLLYGVELLNWRHRRRLGSDAAFVVKPGILAPSRGQTYLRRRVRTEVELAQFIDALWRLLFLGTNGTYNDGRTLPARCYEESASLISDLGVLRALWIRCADPAEPEHACDEQRAEALHKKFTGVERLVEADHLERLARGLMDSSIRFVARLCEEYPFDGEHDLRTGDAPLETPSNEEDARASASWKEGQAIIAIDLEEEQVLFFGRRVERIQPLPLKVLCCLTKKAGEWVDVEDIGKKVGSRSDIKKAVSLLRRRFAEATTPRVVAALRAAIARNAAPSRSEQWLRSDEPKELMRALFGNRPETIVRSGYRLCLPKEKIQIAPLKNESKSDC